MRGTKSEMGSMLGTPEMVPEGATGATLNYIWVGCPPKLEEGGEVGHDMLGPKEMATIVAGTVRINFFCLEEYVAYYRNNVGKLPINVCSIEAFLEENKASFLEDTTQVCSILKKLIFTAGRNQIRDRVTMLDLLKLYIVSVKGGYALDTNIIPQQAPNFPEYDSFHIPALTQFPKSMSDVDAWMIYSPSNNRVRAQRCLKHYIDLAIGIEQQIFDQEGYSKNYHDCCSWNILRALCLIDNSENLNVDGLQFWGTEQIGAEKHCYARDVSELRVR